jgi:hypothetical protein
MKLMNGRILIMPVLSVVMVAVLLSRPDITGLAVAKPSGAGASEISANITVIIPEDGFVPEGSEVLIYLDDREASMGIADFINKSGASYDRGLGKIQSIGYEGYGFTGAHSYVLGISDFGIGASVEPGSHSLVVLVLYGKNIISRSSQTIDTN